MRKAGEIVTALFRERFGSEFMETARSTAGLFSSWEKIAAEIWSAGPGQNKDDLPAAAVHSRIRELERGVLLIEADHPGWVQILQTKQSELLSAIQRRYPEMGISGIAFRLSQEPMPVQASAMSNNAPQPEIEKPDVVSGDEYKNWESHRNKNEPVDEEFYLALKELEESIKKRNDL